MLWSTRYLTFTIHNADGEREEEEEDEEDDKKKDERGVNRLKVLINIVSHKYALFIEIQLCGYSRKLVRT